MHCTVVFKPGDLAASGEIVTNSIGAKLEEALILGSSLGIVVCAPNISLSATCTRPRSFSPADSNLQQEKGQERFLPTMISQ